LFDLRLVVKLFGLQVFFILVLESMKKSP